MKNKFAKTRESFISLIKSLSSILTSCPWEVWVNVHVCNPSELTNTFLFSAVEAFGLCTHLSFVFIKLYSIFFRRILQTHLFVLKRIIKI